MAGEAPKAVTVGDVSKAQSVMFTPEELSMVCLALQGSILSQARAQAKSADQEITRAMAQRLARLRLLEARLASLV